jgi:hypothetical protein
VVRRECEMYKDRHNAVGILAVFLLCCATSVTQNSQSTSLAVWDDPAIEYAARAPDDPVARLKKKIDSGEINLKFEGDAGYLRSVLAELRVPVESQLEVFSKTGVQRLQTTPRNPRLLFYNDSTIVGWVPGGFIEFVAQDARQGMMFYTLSQTPQSKPNIQRQMQCLVCHDSNSAAGVPGALLRSVVTGTDGTGMPQFGESIVDHRTPFSKRWGGWYVTGKAGSVKHLGNEVAVNSPKDTTGPVRFVPVQMQPRTEFPNGSSDVVALMVFEHQMHMMNLLTRFGWDLRAVEWRQEHKDPISNAAEALTNDVNELVDYLLFVDEAPLPRGIRGSSGFTELFSSEGPRDSQGRSLRQLDLRRRLMRYPCSYMIYSEAFDSLPAQGREMMYRRMWDVLSGKQRGKGYARLSLKDRQNVAGILIETKPGVPTYFRVPSR